MSTNAHPPKPHLREVESPEVARRKLAAQLGLEADDPLLLLVQANANLEEKVELWSTAILELAALAKQQNQTMQETSQNSLKLMHALQSSALESAPLTPLIKQLDSSCSRLNAEQERLAQQDWTQVFQQTLTPIIAELQRSTSQPPAHQKAIGNISHHKWLWGAVLVQWVTTLLFIGSGWQWQGQLLTYQQALYQRSVWTIQKLERMEQALGVGSK